MKADMGSPKDVLVATFHTVSALFIVTPPAENRVSLTNGTAEAAKEVGVEFIMVVSGRFAEVRNTIIGKHLSEIEEKISSLRVPYTLPRLPFFMDNDFGSKDSIIGQSTIHSPVDPEIPYVTVAIEDVEKAAAAILADPSKHTNKTYHVVSDRHTSNDVAAAFSAALGREIKYVRVPYEAQRKTFQDQGWPQWQVDAVMEIYHYIDNKSPTTDEADMSHFELITGEKPTDLKTWVSQVAKGFQG